MDAAKDPIYETRLRRILVEEGRKPSWLADQCDVRHSTVTFWMNGSKSPSKRNMERVAQALRRSEQDIFFTPIDAPLHPEPIGPFFSSDRLPSTGRETADPLEAQVA